jgi:hypothetical protein
MISLLPVISLQAQFHESFDSPTTSWIRSETDCIIRNARWQQRRTNERESRNRFEKISFEAGAGTQILVCHNVPPTFVISELMPSVRIKAPRPGIQMKVRVVLPHSRSPNGEGPLTTLLPGPTYRQAGSWETLSFKADAKDLPRKLQEEIWLLRRKHGPQVTQRDAYIDKVVLNLYTAADENEVQIDDLKVDGIVAADQIARNTVQVDRVYRDAQVQTVGLETPLEKQESLVVRDGTVLLVKKKPFFPRIIQHRGESFEFLQSLGFNVIELKATASYEQLEAARRLDLWIVCPAPSSVGLSPIDFTFDRVLAWSVGEKLTGRNLQNVQQLVREIREYDMRRGRPIVGAANSRWVRFAQQVDILNVGLEPIGTSFLASQYGDWISQRSQSIANSKPVWADIQTDLSQALKKQINAIARQIPPTPLEPAQMKFLVYEAITGGARGLRFKSASRLDAADPTTRIRALTIEWVNSEISRLEPWAAAGALLGKVAIDQSDLEVTAIATNRSRLLLVQRPTHHEQYLAGDVPLRTISFRDSEATISDRMFLIKETGLESLPGSRNLGGNEIRIENCPYAAAVVLTQDPLITNKLSQSYRESGGQSTFQMHTELTRQWLAIMQLIDQQMGRMGRSTSAASAAMNEAVNAFRTAGSLIENSSSQAALPYLDQTDERLAFARREMVTEPLGMFQSKTSSPLVAHCSLIPLHWELSSRLGSQKWNPNGLPGGDFENLQHMMKNGWENRRLDDEQVATKVELTSEAAFQGEYGMRLEVNSLDSSQPIDATPLWIASPQIPVRGGQLVRIHGWVNIPRVIQGNPDGLMIVDSLGGQYMAERIPVTDGWQEFTLYRGVESDRDLQVTFALTGVGEAMFDEVTIRTVDLPSSQRQAKIEKDQR